MHRVLIIDQGNLRGSLASMLQDEDLATIFEADACAGLHTALEDRPEILLLNLPLTGMTPVEFSRGLRNGLARLPLVILGEDDEAEKVCLLDSGADDYVVKPFSLRELLARMRAILRRTTSAPARVIRFGGAEAHLDRRVVMRDGREVSLTPMEYDLLAFFLDTAGRSVTREEILSSVWGCAGGLKTRTVDVCVMKLRQKLEYDSAAPRHFLTVHRVGYRFLR
jgi:DNA-binding response OmpR family regulator